jgi:hypothetical protein
MYGRCLTLISLHSRQSQTQSHTAHCRVHGLPGRTYLNLMASNSFCSSLQKVVTKAEGWSRLTWELWFWRLSMQVEQAGTRAPSVDENIAGPSNSGQGSLTAQGAMEGYNVDSLLAALPADEQEGFAPWNEQEAATALRESRDLVRAWCACPITNKLKWYESNAGP